MWSNGKLYITYKSFLYKIEVSIFLASTQFFLLQITYVVCYNVQISMFTYTLQKRGQVFEKKARKILTIMLVIAMLMPSSIRPFPALAASSWSPTLFANTEAFQIIDDTDTTVDLRLTFGTTLNKSLLYERTLTRFKFDDDLYIQGDLSVNGTMSGRSLRVYGAMSGNSLFVARALSGAGLTDCDTALSSKLLWDSTTGRFSCGTDQTGGGSTPEVGTLSFTGGVLRLGDARYVKKEGDTMTGALVISMATASTASGAFVIAQNIHQTGAFIGSTSDRAPALALDIAGTSAAPHVLFGHQGVFDTNLFRQAANILRTDDSLFVQETLSGAHVKADRILTSSGEMIVEGRSTHNGVTVFNEDSTSTSHVRMESDTQVNMFFLDATNDRIGVGTATPKATLDVLGTISGSELRIQGSGTATFDGNLTFGNAITDAITVNAGSWSFANNTAFTINGGAGTLEVVGGLSGSALTVSNLQNCDTIDTNASGVLSCGTDDGGAGGPNEVGTTAFTGGVIRIADTRYISKQGGTMTGGLKIDITSSDLVKTSSGRTAITDFLYDAGASLLNLVSENDYLTIAEGAVSNAGQGTLTTPSSIVTTANVGAGSFTILRDDGKYVIVHGNATATASVWDGIALTMSASATNATTATIGAGALAVRRPDGRYLVVNGGGAATSALFDPRGITATAAGPAVCAATTGTNAFQIGSGTYVIMCGGNGNWGTYNPTNNTYVAGTGLAFVFGAGAHAIQRDDGTFLVFAGGNSTSHYLYNPFSNQWVSNPITSGAPTITTGAFSIRRADGRFLIIGGAVNTSTIYDPTPTSSNQGAGSFTAQSGAGYGPTVALGDGAGAVWRQDGKYFLVIGAGSTATNIVDPSNGGAGQFIAGPSLNANPGAGSHTIIRPDGKAQIIRGGAATTTDVYDFGFIIGGPSTSTGAVYTTECMVAPALSSGSLLDFTVNSEDKISFEVRTGNGSCSGSYKPILNSGDRISPVSGDNRVQVRATFQRSIPKFADQEWGLRRGLSQVRYRRVNRDPTLYDVSISNTTGLHRTQFDFGTSPDPSGPVTVNIANNTNKNMQIALAVQNSFGSTFNATQQNLNNGAFSTHAPLPTTAGVGTIVMKRPDGKFVIIAGNATTPTSIVYDPALETFTANTVNPTKRAGTGALAFKRPDGKFLIVLGAGTNVTNIYDPVGNTFTAGPTMTQPVGEGSLPIPLPNGRVLVLHGGFLKTSTVYDPLSNTTTSGATMTMSMGRGTLGIPRPDGTWLVIPGASNATCAPRTNTALFNPYNMQFIPNTAVSMVTGTGPGAHAFQRSDGQWMIIKGGATAITCAAIGTTNIYNAEANRMFAGPAATAPRFGGFAMQRPDGSYAIIQGNAVTTTSIYYEKSGAFTTESSGAPVGTIVAGPALVTSTGTGTLGFQRDDGKYVIFAGSNTAGIVGTTTVQLFDPGWVSSGYYRSENTYVPDMDSTSTLSWRALPTNNGISAEVRTATGALALQTKSAHDVATPGGLILPRTNDKWLQVGFNLKRTFPSYGGIWTDVWYNGGTGNNVTFRTIATPTITEYSVGKDTNLVDLKADALSVFRVSTNGDIYSGTKGSVQTGGADLAERYTSPDELVAGEVVSIDYSSNHGVKRATYSYQPDVLGVVSTAPGFVAGAFTKGSYPIALVGRVPVKVSTENGPIFMGDRVTSSSIPGAGTKAMKAGRTVGIAMENLDMNKLEPCGVDKKIECGTVMMFVNLSDWPGPGK